MSEVRKYVNKMFAGYPKNEETLDLKEEVIGNLEAEMEDLVINKGFSAEQAFKVSTEKMDKLDGVIEGVQTIQLNKVMVEITQWLLLYLLVAWIVSIPLNIYSSLRATSWLLFILIIIIGIFYIVLKFSGGFLTNDLKNINLGLLKKWQKVIWIIWTLFIVGQWGMITAVYFGSDIWFGRTISFDGPYQFGQIVTSYLAPLVSIIIPLLMNRLRQMLILGGKHRTYEE